jgi:hypothetical protein
MLGVGSIYRLYRSGACADDDEVAVIHAPAYLDYRPLSHAMLNIRYTLRRLLRLGAIEAAFARAVAPAMKALHFSQRTDDELRGAAQHLAGDSNADRFAQRFAEAYIDAKKRDAQALVEFLARDRVTPLPRQFWHFPATRHWRQQFVHEVDDVPKLV